MERRSIADGVRADRLQPDHRFPPFERGSGFPYWNRFAAVNDEFIGIHMDDEEGRTAGYPSAFGMGNLTWAYFHVALHSWLGLDCRIVSLSTRFRAAVVRGTRVVVTGSVVSVTAEGEDQLVEVDLRAQDGAGGLLAPARAVVSVPPQARRL
jgi:hypothetical protein